jgi:hypothetical protein
MSFSNRTLTQEEIDRLTAPLSDEEARLVTAALEAPKGTPLEVFHLTIGLIGQLDPSKQAQHALLLGRAMLFPETALEVFQGCDTCHKADGCKERPAFQQALALAMLDADPTETQMTH